MRWRPVRRTVVALAEPEAGSAVTAELSAARDEVTARVRGLAERGALDAGNGDVLDGWLERLRASLRARIEVQRGTAVSVARAERGELGARVVEAERAALAAGNEADETERALDVLRDELFRSADVGSHDPERRRRLRPTGDRLEGLAEPWWNRTVLWVLLALAAAGDLATFYIVLAGTFREAGDVVVGFLTAAFTAASVGLMHCAGRALKSLRETRTGLGRPTIALLLLGWLGLGGVAAYFRSQVQTSTTTPGSIFDTDTAVEAAAAAQEQLLSAVLLAGLFLASGLLAFYVGYCEHHPRVASYRALRKRLVRQRKRQLRKAAAEERARQALLLNGDAEALAASRAEADRRHVDATVEELKELVRVLVAEHVGLPEATNGLTTGRDASGGRPQGGSSVGVPRPRGFGAVVLASAGDLSSNGHGPSRSNGEGTP